MKISYQHAQSNYPKDQNDKAMRFRGKLLYICIIIGDIPRYDKYLYKYSLGVTFLFTIINLRYSMF